MTYYPDDYQQFLTRLRHKRHSAIAARHSDRVTDNRDQYYLRRMDLDTPPPRNTLARHHKLVSLILEAIVVWAAVAAVIWWLNN